MAVSNSMDAYSRSAARAAAISRRTNGWQQIVQFMRNPPLVEHAAQHMHRPTEEGTLFRRERRCRKFVQTGPVGPAAEQFALPPHRAGVERLLLGPGYLRKCPAEPAQQRVAQQTTSQRRQAEHQRCRQRDPVSTDMPPPGRTRGLKRLPGCPRGAGCPFARQQREMKPILPVLFVLRESASLGRDRGEQRHGQRRDVPSEPSHWGMAKRSEPWGSATPQATFRVPNSTERAALAFGVGLFSPATRNGIRRCTIASASSTPVSSGVVNSSTASVPAME